MMRTDELARVVGGRVEGAAVGFGSVSTDSRTLGPKALFVALRGERFDGHAFLGAAARAGAAAALVEDATAHAGLPCVVVPDARDALCRLAAHWRRRFAVPLIAVAGSNGKTTTKEMLAAVLRAQWGETGVLATAGNLNTDIGVSLTLLGARSAHRAMVIELGTNHRGEIRHLCGIARPTVAVVTNAQRDHLEFLGSIEQMADENADVLRALPPEGTAVVNADDACAPLFVAASGGRRIVTFGSRAGADVRAGARVRGLSSELALRTPAGEAQLRLGIAGAHHVSNALAAAACAHALGVAPATIATGLERFLPAPGRMQPVRAPGGVTLIDDSYNANPDSVRAAIDVLAGCAGCTVLVLGDMGEVGVEGPAFHREVGTYARTQGVTHLITLGEAAADAAHAFGPTAVYAPSLDALLDALAARVRDGATVLVKGSRFMRMERVVAALRAGADAVGAACAAPGMH